MHTYIRIGEWRGGGRGVSECDSVHRNELLLTEMASFLNALTQILKAVKS